MAQSQKPSIAKRAALASASLFSNRARVSRARMFESWAKEGGPVDAKVAMLEKSLELHERVAKSNMARGIFKEQLPLVSGRKSFKRAFASYGEAARVCGELANTILLAEDHEGAAKEYARASSLYSMQLSIIFNRNNTNNGQAETIKAVRMNMADSQRYSSVLFAAGAKENGLGYGETMSLLRKAFEAQDSEIMLRTAAGDVQGTLGTMRIKSTILLYMLRTAEKNRNQEAISYAKQRLADLSERMSFVLQEVSNRKVRETGFDVDAYARRGAERLSVLSEQNRLPSDSGVTYVKLGPVGSHSAVFEQNRITKTYGPEENG